MRNKRNSQRGQTILLVAVSLVTLLGLAALAIDVVTLYVTRSEAQRCADAAALAGAKLLVDTGLTTDPCNGTLALAAQTLAIQQAQMVAQQNVIAGQAPPAANVTVTFPNGASPSCGLASPSPFGINPQVKVVVTRTGLPTFFARIWNRGLGTVSATATAEAYNPSNSASLNASGTVIPIAPRCVKPMLLPNCDPGHPGGPACGGTVAPFVNIATGAITNPGRMPAGVIGEMLTGPRPTGKAIHSACGGAPGLCAPVAPTAGQYYPITLNASALYLCPSCSSNPGGFQSDLECCNASTAACGQTVPVDYTVDPDPTAGGGIALSGGQCLIHQNPGGGGQDQIDITTQSPELFIAQDNNPFVGSSVQVGDHILTSDSVVTFPLYDDSAFGGSFPPPGSSVTVIGYLQAFINQVNPDGSFDVTVLNVSGCGNSPVGTPIQGASTSVPVRLIQTP